MAFSSAAPMFAACPIAVIGLGYVGLPLANILSKRYFVIGYDTDRARVEELRRGLDSTGEAGVKNLLLMLVSDLKSDTYAQSVAEAGIRKKHAVLAGEEGHVGGTGLYITCTEADLDRAQTYIITVPTPVDQQNQPDFTALIVASEAVARQMRPGALVIYESTVYPGATEEICIPVLERISGMSVNRDFGVGYSPERVNPGDAHHAIDQVVKVVSGLTAEVTDQVEALYRSVIPAGTYRASSIRVAEAAKVVENAQRDLNIAFVNDLAKMFHLMGLDTQEVLNTAATKWNFMPFQPGLVGGHCIGVDPYYLADKAKQHGYYPETILAGRRLNDSMPEYIAGRVTTSMLARGLILSDAKVLNLGITYKEHTRDVRNSKAAELVKKLQEYGVSVVTFDPWADVDQLSKCYALTSYGTFAEVMAANAMDEEMILQSHASAAEIKDNVFDVIILTVAHRDFLALDFRKLLTARGFIFDVKGILKEADERL